jgi:hypothetical protein
VLHHVFSKHEDKEFIILAIYVDIINISGTPKMTAETIITLKGVFKMKDVAAPSYSLGLQFDHLLDGVLISQSTYIKKIIK